MLEILHAFLDGLTTPCLALLILIVAGQALSTLGRHLLRGFGQKGVRSIAFYLCAVAAVIVGGGKSIRRGGDSSRDTPTERRDADRGATTEDSTPSPFRISAISLSDGMCSVETVWTNGMFEAGTILDYLVKTNLLDTLWTWDGCDAVAEGVTNVVHGVSLDALATLSNGLDDVTYRIPPKALFVSVVPRLEPTDMRDSDQDGLPDIYEWRHNRNPWVPDLDLVPHSVLNTHSNLQTVVDDSIAYDVVEIAPGTYEGQGWSNVRLPAHPVLVTGGHGIPTIRGSGFADFILPSNTTEQTVIQNLYLTHPNDGLQVGFWCGGNLPWVRRSASATFRNIHLRFPNPKAFGYGWLFYGSSTNRSVISHCTVNAQGSSRVRGIYAIDPPPLDIDHSTFLNFPPSSSTNTSTAILIETKEAINPTNESPISIHDSVFDGSFTNAEIVARIGLPTNTSISIWNTIMPRMPQVGTPCAMASLWITNAGVTVSGFPIPGSPAEKREVGALSLIDPADSRDSDGDGLSDWDEAYHYGTSPRAWDSDGDRMSDAKEIGDGTDPNNMTNYRFNLHLVITNNIGNASGVRLAAFEGGRFTDRISGIHSMSNGENVFEFQSLLVTNGVVPVVWLWYDANTNDVCDADEWRRQLIYKVTSHRVSRGANLSELVDTVNGIPVYWWEAYNFTNVADRVATADPDQDGLINLHEYWAGTNPNEYDGTNTLLSVLSRSVDDRIQNTLHTNRVDMFSSIVTNTPYPRFVTNENLWLKGVDLSCASIWSLNPPSITNKCGPTDFKVTLIGFSEVVYSSHIDCYMPTNRIHIFRGRSGELYSRRLIKSAGIAYDIAVGVLDSELPAYDFSPAQYLPTNFWQYVNTGKYLPEFFFNESLKAYVMTFEGVDFADRGSKRFGRRINIGNRSEYWKPGDVYSGSSSPRFLLLGDVPVIIGTLWWQVNGNVSSAFAVLFKEDIERMIHFLEGCNDFSLREVDLSSFPILPGAR